MKKVNIKYLFNIINNIKYINLISYLTCKILIFILILYQKYISIWLGSNCRYIPSCSQYMINSLKIHGILKGIFFSIIRLLKCNPFISLKK